MPDLLTDLRSAISDQIQRYHDAMARITNRVDIRDDVSRYEAVAIALVHPRGDNIAEVVADYPLTSSPLAFDRFFDKLYEKYDLRFVYSAAALKKYTRRLEWLSDSPVLAEAESAGFRLRIAAG
jgi:hypothetical protein